MSAQPVFTKTSRQESVDMTTCLDTEDSEPSWHYKTTKVQRKKNGNMRVTFQEAFIQKANDCIPETNTSESTFLKFLRSCSDLKVMYHISVNFLSSAQITNIKLIPTKFI